MKTFMSRIALSAAIAASALSFSPIASAQTLELDLGNNGGPRLRLNQDCNPRTEDCGPRARNGVVPDRRDGRNSRRSAERQCTEDRALDKAERMGLRRARIESAGRRVIEVRGVRRGDRVIVAFGRAPGCPIVS